MTGGHTVYEPRGICCLLLELMEPTRKGIAMTRSFGTPVASWQQMRKAIASYAIRKPALCGELDREKRERPWGAMNKLNATRGRDTVRILVAGPKGAAQDRAALVALEDSMDELLHVNAR